MTLANVRATRQPRLRPTWSSSILLALLLQTSGWGVPPASLDLRIRNGHVAAAFDPRSGALRQLTDLQAGFDFLKVAGVESELWEVRLLEGSPAGALRPSMAREFHGRSLGPEAQIVELVWEQFETNGPSSLRVIVRAEAEMGGLNTHWKMRIEGLGPLRIDRIMFPRLSRLVKQPDERLAVPVWMGQVIREPRAALLAGGASNPRWEWSYPGILSMQCQALYAREGLGLYCSSDDTHANRKAFAWQGTQPDDLSFEMIHFPDAAEAGSSDYAMPYEAIVGPLRGDWTSAAERYRDWGTRQAWARESRRARGLVPGWLLETGLWVWNRGRSEGVLQPAVALRRELGLPVHVFWHWWHGCSYDVGFPEYFPPREGLASCAQALQQAHAQELRAIVYMNQRLWGMSTQSWTNQGAERFAVKNSQGKVEPEVYNIFTGLACASMCLGTEFWRDTYGGLADRALHELGVDGIYMDQACTSLLCYDPAHGHPLGGGAFWLEGFRQLSESIRRRSADVSPVLLAGEGAGEAWLPYLDLMLTLQVSRERYAGAGEGWDVIPFFQAVYHPYAVTYGSYSSLTFPPYDELWPSEHAPPERLTLLDRKYSGQFELEQARSFVWGVQPTIANFLPGQLLERADEIRFALQLARVRQRSLKYLQDGTFLRPPALECPSLELEMSRISIYAGQTTQSSAEKADGATAARVYPTFRKSVPALMAGAWRARDGAVGIALVNISGQNQVAELVLEPGYYGLRSGLPVHRTTEQGRALVGSWQEGAPLRMDLPARSASLVEVGEEP